MNTIYFQKSSALRLASLLMVSVALTACGTTTHTSSMPDGKTRPAVVLPKQASNAEILYGENHDTLSVIESKYLQNKSDALLAARYGKALREEGQLKQAQTVLLTASDSKEAGTLANTELSAIYLSNGDFDKAENAARKAIKQDEANYRAWRNLGNALDAQEKYPEGETAFRRALDIWTGDDKVPVMNNLALNLAAQGYTDRALTLLYQAQKLSPDRVEIERNIRIIRTLSEPPDFSKPKLPFPDNKVPE